MQSWTSPAGNTPQDTNCTATWRTRHAGLCWRSRDELIRDLLLWTPTHGRAKAGRPARTYIQQLCEDTGCCPEDLPRAMNDREEWRERVRDIRATSVIWWWWWLVCSLFLRRRRRIFTLIILWSDDTSWQEECVSQFKELIIYFLFKNI